MAYIHEVSTGTRPSAYEHDGIYRILLKHEDPNKPSAVTLNITYSRFEGYDGARVQKLYGSQPNDARGVTNLIELTVDEANRHFKPRQLRLVRKYDKPIDTTNRWGKRPNLKGIEVDEVDIGPDIANEPDDTGYDLGELLDDINKGRTSPVEAARQINRMAPDDAHEIIAYIIPNVNAIRAPKLIKELDSPHTVRAALLAEQSRDNGARPQLEKLIQNTLDKLRGDEA